MAPTAPPPTAGPLAGVTVLDLSTVGPAARATRLLADYGATVVKVGAVPGRGPAPVMPPFFAYSAQRGMRRVQLDVRHPDGLEAFLALAAGADVVVESFRPGVVDRLGIGYEDVRAVNAGIVYCSTSGYGQEGPRATWAGHDLNYLAVAGFLATSGPRADGGPPIPGATIADAAAGGMHAALAITAALFSRHLTGEGTFLDVSVADGALWLMSLAVDEHLAIGTEPGPGHDVLTGRYACYDTYRAADGRWLAVAAIEAKFFANLCRALGCEEWTDRQYDDDAQDEVRAAFTAAFARYDRDTWVAKLSADDTCVAPVQAVAEITHDPQFASRGAVVAVSDIDGRSFSQLGALLAGMPPVSAPVIVSDPTETDTDELLESAGVDPARIATLRGAGVVA
ncbi:MAG TPA: CaiB/BaiF CoA-transferase family protein [Acidimicrobiales bacterium]|nr:CaiB/BaiF CoA-transferase family protein [Acidimicrobiales bacterium]